jgi:hypothetical protein
MNNDWSVVVTSIEKEKRMMKKTGVVVMAICLSGVVLAKGEPDGSVAAAVKTLENRKATHEQLVNASAVFAKQGPECIPEAIKHVDGDRSPMQLSKAMSKAHGDAYIAALEKKLAEYARDWDAGQASDDPKLRVRVASRGFNKILNHLGSLGAPAIPALVRALDHGYGRDGIINLVGPKASKILPKMAAQPIDNVDSWKPFYAMVMAAAPEAFDEAGDELLNKLRNDEMHLVNYIGMVLDELAPNSIKPVADILADKKEDWYARWAAARVLEMMGPKAKVAVPVLEKALQNENEDIDIRVASAAAIAHITGQDPFDLYKTIPNYEDRILEAAWEKSLKWRREFMTREASESAPESSWAGMAWWVYSMATEQNLDRINNAMVNVGLGNGVGVFMDVNTIRTFMLGRKDSEFFPGRIYPVKYDGEKDVPDIFKTKDGKVDTEACMKDYYFRKAATSKHHINFTSAELLGSQEEIIRTKNANIPMNFMVRDFCALGVLKDDPKHRDRKFPEQKIGNWVSGGDTVLERYNAYVDYFKAHLRFWAPRSGFMEHASSNYEWHTYGSYFNLADIAPDPEVRKLAKMFLDIVLVEANQVTISNLRGGNKSRPKRGGLGSNFNPYRGMLYGERGTTMYHAPLTASTYKAQPVAALLHKLGPLDDRFEVVNRVALHTFPDHKTNPQPSHAMNYYYRTPEYVIGAVTHDPNGYLGGDNKGRWSGVVFRDLSVISLGAYTDTKWFAMSKDVMVGQKAIGFYSRGGQTQVAFERFFDQKIEKDGWVFVDNGGAFGAVKFVWGDYHWKDPIRRVMLSSKNDTPFIIQCGMKEDYGSFKAFQKAILAAPLKVSKDKVEYHGPNSAKIEFFPVSYEKHAEFVAADEAYIEAVQEVRGAAEQKLWGPLVDKLTTEFEANPAWRQPNGKMRSLRGPIEKMKKQSHDVQKEIDKIVADYAKSNGLKNPRDERRWRLPKIDGKTQNLALEYDYKSPYLESKTNSGIVYLMYGDRKWKYDLNKIEIAEITKK